MKKSVLIFGSALMLFACQKEDQQIEENPNLSRKSAAEYEIYEYPSDYENVLDGKLDTIELDNALNNTSIQKAIWILESGINYVYAHDNWEFDDISEDNLDYTFSRDANGNVEGQDITDKFLDIYDHIENNTPEGHELLAIDVRFNNISSNDVGLAINIKYADGPSVVSGSANGPLASDGPREAGTDDGCSGYTTPSNATKTVFYLGKRAFIGYQRTKYGTSPLGHYFATNLVRYRPTSTAWPLSSDKLFGQSNSVVSTYNTLSDKTTCLSENIMDQYSQEIYDEFQGKTSSSKTVVNYGLEQINSGPNCAWGYKHIDVASWPSANTQSGFSP